MNEVYAIEMLGITKKFGNILANDKIDIRLQKGHILALCGENGAGKSTIMSILFGLYEPDEGIIKKDGKEVRITDPNEATKLNIGMVHQHFKLIDTFTVLENIILGDETLIEYKDNLLRNKQLELNNKEEELKSLHHDYIKQLSKIENKEYCISCFKDEISNNHAEIRYLKNNTFTKKILSPIGYLYLIFKSKPKEISLNLKLFKTLKESECFDIGFYLNNNKDLIKSKWCKYFSPELHYVCNGFTEKRTFNKKYFNRTTKEDLLNYLLNCNK